jgi:fatty acyl-CoA reductase
MAAYKRLPPVCRMMDPIVLAYGKGQMTGFLANPQGVLDVVSA